METMKLLSKSYSKKLTNMITIMITKMLQRQRSIKVKRKNLGLHRSLSLLDWFKPMLSLLRWGLTDHSGTSKFSKDSMVMSNRVLNSWVKRSHKIRRMEENGDNWKRILNWSLVLIFWKQNSNHWKLKDSRKRWKISYFSLCLMVMKYQYYRL